MTALQAVDWSVFRISLQVAVLATLLCVAVGTPLAWWIARSRPVVSGVLSSLALVPLVLPPVSVGYYLLYLFGRQSGFGGFLIDDLGLRIVFSWYGAGLAAAVVALPLFVRTAQAGFEQISPSLLDVAATMTGPRARFLRVVLPLAWPSLAAATLIALARSVGEFGATVVVAGSIPGSTRTVPAAIYDAVQGGDHALANALALITAAGGLVILVALTALLRRARRP
jgi:molybdate transport system permease protein